MKHHFIFVSLALGACQSVGPQNLESRNDNLIATGEKNFRSIRQLTFGGTNAEGYWSWDGRKITFQHRGTGLPGLVENPEPQCDQIYTLELGKNGEPDQVRKISNGQGRTTCSFFVPGAERIIFSSTHGHAAACPPTPSHARGYVWPLYPEFQVYSAKEDGTDIRPLEKKSARAYIAEMTFCKDGTAVFTSTRDGDIEIYTGKLNSEFQLVGVKRITRELGYDGGAFFSSDCSQIVWRASRPETSQEKEEYLGLLKQNLVKPAKVELFVANRDGTNAKQITRLGAASFAPFFTPDSRKIIFSSNFKAGSREFDLYLVDVDGKNLRRITHWEGKEGRFEGFPMFSPDGKWLVFASNRNGKQPRETNLFLAEWID